MIYNFQHNLYWNFLFPFLSIVSSSDLHQTEKLLAYTIKLKVRFNRHFSFHPLVWLGRIFLETLSRTVRFKNRKMIGNFLFVSEWIEYIILVMLVVYLVHTIDNLTLLESLEHQNYLVYLHSDTNLQSTSSSSLTEHESRLFSGTPTSRLSRNRESKPELLSRSISNPFDIDININQFDLSSTISNPNFPSLACKWTKSINCSASKQLIVRKIALRVLLAESQKVNPTVWGMFHINRGKCIQWRFVLQSVRIFIQG